MLALRRRSKTYSDHTHHSYPLCACSPTGKYLDDDATNATKHDGDDDCISCPAGTYGPATGASSLAFCSACAAGKTSETGAEACIQCYAGTAANTSTGMCDNCTFGRYSETGATTCISCVAGYHVKNMNTECVVCGKLCFPEYNSTPHTFRSTRHRQTMATTTTISKILP